MSIDFDFESHTFFGCFEERCWFITAEKGRVAKAKGEMYPCGLDRD